MNSINAVEVTDVHKEFVLPQHKNRSLKQAFIGLLSKRHIDKQKVLDGVSFQIKKGDFVGIVGRNGSGKSTLLKIIAGVYNPNMGSVAVKGNLIPFIELGVGFNPELSGRDNVFLNGALLGFDRKHMERIYDDIVAFAELEEAMDKKLKNYSSGMQVRLAFSIAIRANGDILLLDEVLAVGDTAFQKKCYKYFAELKEKKQTVILVSHDQGAVEKFCNRAILLEDGKVVADGKPREIYREYFNEMERIEAEKSSKPTRDVTNDILIIDSLLVAGTKSNQPNIFTPADTHIKVRLTAHAMQKVSSPVYGIVIKKQSTEEIPLIVTNTRVLGKESPDMDAGDTMTVEFDIENVFGDGRYTITALAAETRPGGTYYDWKDNIAAFTIYDRPFNYVPLYINHSVAITKGKK
jgi:ABC-2 type transport system ATP-binding protein